MDCLRPASGMATALDPILRASGGVWVAHGSGDADLAMVDEFDHVFVPPGDPLYTLRRVWLDKKLEEEYYCGLANEGLWPLCHISFNRPVFRPQDWESYREANRIFANAVLEEAGGDRAFVFIQDYHFGLLPRMLKVRNPNLIIAQFWHIPWPNREIFRAFPWKEELLDGMLGNDLLGFHLRHHCTNFLDTIDRGLEALVDIEHFNVLRHGKTTMVRPFPISIDFEQHTRSAASPQTDLQMEIWRERLGITPDTPEPLIGAGIDRIDYTKGIPDRLRGFDLFLERNPEYLERVVFVQVGVPSRIQIAQYHALNDEVDGMVAEINAKWSTRDWRPIVFFKRHFSQVELMALHRLSTFCLVSSLHDGMNLVAKEY
ncbi:MAG: alpha,alpha-trehalose-phosphate synthase (UDP-forming), partial [Terriglobales bacterium]